MKTATKDKKFLQSAGNPDAQRTIFRIKDGKGYNKTVNAYHRLRATRNFSARSGFRFGSFGSGAATHVGAGCFLLSLAAGVGGNPALAQSPQKQAMTPPARATHGPRKVAVFGQPGFPIYGVSALINPGRIARNLKAAGVDADVLDVDALANSARFNARAYAAVIFPYGNTYPQEAFANVRAFHLAGGSLITTGIPFTHGAARIAARNWDATPEWNGSVRLVIGMGPKPGVSALQIRHVNSDWSGVNSPRFAVRPGETVRGTVAIKDGPPAVVRPSNRRPANNANRPRPNQTDEFFVRFYDASGSYLEQKSVPLPAPPIAEWKPDVAVEIAAPAKAAFADLSVQVRRRGRTVLAADFAAQTNGKAVAINNAALAPSPSDFADLGHRDETALWGPEGIGIGGFSGPDSVRPVPFKALNGDPLGLAKNANYKGATGGGEPAQWINLKTLPKGVSLVPLAGDAARPIVALVVHQSDKFAPAVDAWAYRPPHSSGDREDYDTEQLVSRATVAVLAKRGALTGSASKIALQRLDKTPAPTVYANVVLPTVPKNYTTFQPKMPPPARQLHVADVRGLNREERVLFQSLQGLVNRKQPRIYFIYDDADKFWLDQLQKQGETDAPVMVSDPWTLVKQFGNETKGVVLSDPKVYESACTAVTLSGADDLLVALTPEIAVKTGLPIKTDLRGKFKNNADAIRYIRTDVLPRLDPYLTCSLDPAVFGSGGLDSIIAARGSVFWITGPKSQNLPGATQGEEMDELRTLFTKMPLGAVVRGFWWHGDGVGMPESEGVALGGRFGKVTLVSDLITNLSVHSGVPSAKLVQKPRKPAPPIDKNKVYFSFTMSDGDNLCTWRDYFRRYFTDPLRGTFPVGWGMAPVLGELAPDWARWYYDNATDNDEFICDVSGYAYMYPSSWGASLKDRDGAFKFFYGNTAQAMQTMDMKTLRLMDVQASDIAHVGPLLPGVDFLLPDYGHAGSNKYNELTYSLPNGQAIFRAATNGQGAENLAQQIRLRAGKSRPAFINAFIWNWGSKLSDLKQVIDLLGPDFVAVTPSQLNELYREAEKTPTTAQK